MYQYKREPLLDDERQSDQRLQNSLQENHNENRNLSSRIY